MSDNSRIGAIILAAGASRRMGRNKALLPIDSQPMIVRVVETFRAAHVEPIIVVTGHEPDAIKSIVPSVEFVHNPHHATRGMLSSIQTGVQLIAAHAGPERIHEDSDSPAPCDAFFLALVDHPFIQASTLQQLRHAWDATKPDVLRPTYHGKHGHPILIAARARCIDSILALRDGDQTLNDFVRAKSTIAVDVPVEDAATIQDIDTPADYDAAINRRDQDSSAD